MINGNSSILFILFIFLMACNAIPDKVRDTISASSNKSELEKAIQHYQESGDKTKLKALYFLLEHIDYHQHRAGRAIENYKEVFNELATTPESRKEWLEVIFDSLTAKRKDYNQGETFVVRDFNSLKAEDLIRHVDAAFVAWRSPWAEDMSFDEFSEYILPYKILEEEPDNWMANVQRSYDYLKLNTDDTYQACLIINDELKRRFKIRSIPPFYDLNYSQLEKIKSGKCEHATQYTAYVMRALGVPVTVDYTYWGNMNGGHNWNALIYKGKSIPFVGSESDPGKTKIDLARQRKRSKVFRYTYAIQKNELQYLTQNTEEIPEVFRSYHTQDVTDQYIPVSDVAVNISPKEVARYVYLCVFNKQTWFPVYWATNSKNNTPLFKDMGRGIVYLPAKYESQQLLAIAPPFILLPNGGVKTLGANSKQKRTVKIVKKSPHGPVIMKGNEYELFYWDSEWQSLGKQMAMADSIMFHDVPDNTLLWVRSKDKSSNERPFIYIQDHQEWY